MRQPTGLLPYRDGSLYRAVVLVALLGLALSPGRVRGQAFQPPAPNADPPLIALRISPTAAVLPGALRLELERAIDGTRSSLMLIGSIWQTRGRHLPQFDDVRDLRAQTFRIGLHHRLWVLTDYEPVGQGFYLFYGLESGWSSVRYQAHMFYEEITPDGLPIITRRWINHQASIPRLTVPVGIGLGLMLLPHFHTDFHLGLAYTGVAAPDGMPYLRRYTRGMYNMAYTGLLPLGNVSIGASF